MVAKQAKETETSKAPAKKPGRNGNVLPRGGRPKGSVNKATATAREAIAKIADGMAPEFEKWIVAIAEGQPAKLDEEGRPVSWLNKPDPRGAAEVYLKAIEYHVPKLSRAELTGPGGSALVPATINVKGVKAPRRE